MATTPGKRVPTPGKKVQRIKKEDNNEDEPPKKKLALQKDTQERDMTVRTIKEIKQMKFTLNDYKVKFFAKVIVLSPPREHKDTDVHYHRRMITLADPSDFIRGYIRNQADNFVQVDHSYMFSLFKIYRHTEILLHEKSIKFV